MVSGGGGHRRLSALPQLNRLVNTARANVGTLLVHIDRCNKVRVSVQCFTVTFRTQLPHSQCLVVAYAEQELAARMKDETADPVVVAY